MIFPVRGAKPLQATLTTMTSMRDIGTERVKNLSLLFYTFAYLRWTRENLYKYHPKICYDLLL